MRDSSLRLELDYLARYRLAGQSHAVSPQRPIYPYPIISVDDALEID